jgi:hypothetical protein
MLWHTDSLVVTCTEEIVQSTVVTYSKGGLMNDKLAPTGEAMTLDCQRVMQVLPHRYPFLLGDRVIALVR